MVNERERFEAEAKKFATEYLQQFPSCIGYPECDGQLGNGEPHEKACPLYPDKEEYRPSYWELMAEFALKLQPGWQAHADSVGPADDYDQKAVDVIKNLAMLVRRLARRLEKHEPGCKMVTQALEYLRGENLQGSILREAESLSGDGATIDDIALALVQNHRGFNFEVDSDSYRALVDSMKLVYSRAAQPASIEKGLEPKTCGKATKFHVIAGASSYACMLAPGHEDECQPGGTCVAHGRYVGATKCPEWPSCVRAALQRNGGNGV